MNFTVATCNRDVTFKKFDWICIDLDTESPAGPGPQRRGKSEYLKVLSSIVLFVLRFISRFINLDMKYTHTLQIKWRSAHKKITQRETISISCYLILSHMN